MERPAATAATTTTMVGVSGIVDESDLSRKAASLSLTAHVSAREQIPAR